jgi:hypothetical protein
VGVFRGRSERGDPDSLKEEIVDGEKPVTLPLEDPEQDAPELPKKKAKALPKGVKRRNDRREINYFGALDDIIAEVYEKQAASYRVVKAVTQLFESRGAEIPFDETGFVRIAGKIAYLNAVREIAWLFGIGPEHAERIVELETQRMLGVREKK